MSEDKPTFATARGELGPWMKAGWNEADAPHRMPGEAHTALNVVWGDAERTIPVAVQDYDGCEALILRVDKGSA